MKKMLLPAMFISLQLAAMQSLIPSGQTVEIFAMGTALTASYAIAHSLAKSVYSPEYFTQGHYDREITMYGNSQPDSRVKKIFWASHGAGQRAVTFIVFNQKMWKTALTANALTTIAARMPGIAGAPLTVQDAVIPLVVGVGVTAAASWATALVSEKVTERYRQSYFPTRTLEWFKERVKLPHNFEDKKLFRYMGALYSDWANLIVGAGASLAVSAYLIATRNNQ